MIQSTENDVLERLDLLIGLTRLAYSEQIEAAMKKLRSDPVVDAVLETAEDWVNAGTLVTSVSKNKNVSQRTVQRRVADLLAAKLLVSRGGGPGTSYRSSGIA